MRKALLMCSVPVAMALLLQVSTAKADGPVEGTVGAKGFLGGNLFSTPSELPSGYDGIGFAGNAGGMGWGAGIYGEARFIKFLGLELGLTYDSSRLMRNVDLNVNGTLLKVREQVDTKSMRIPILVKGILPIPFGRIAAFLGPELVRPSSVSASNEITNNSNAQLATKINAIEKSSTMLTMGMGLTIELPAKLELPIELRASKNMSQDAEWGKRVDLVFQGNNLMSYSVRSQNSWDFRLGVGLGYRF